MRQIITGFLATAGVVVGVLFTSVGVAAAQPELPGSPITGIPAIGPLTGTVLASHPSLKLQQPSTDGGQGAPQVDVMREGESTLISIIGLATDQTATFLD